MSTNLPNERSIPAVVRAGTDPDVMAPDGSEIRLLVGATQGISRASACEVTLPAGAVSRAVWHQHVEEVWYILEGRGEVWRCPPTPQPITAPPVDVVPGDTLTIPTGWRFQFRAAAGGPLRFLCLTCPAWPGPDEARAAPTEGYWTATV